jgi:hypothetical protein
VGWGVWVGIVRNSASFLPSGALALQSPGTRVQAFFCPSHSCTLVLACMRVPGGAFVCARVRVFLLTQFDKEGSLSQNVGFSTREPVAAYVLRLGLKYTQGVVVGGDARCVTMLDAFRQFFTTDALQV